jgi:HSP20 family protein
MKLDLEKWNPFKFDRSSSKGRNLPPQGQAQDRSGHTSPSSDVWGPGMLDPFRLLNQLLWGPMAASGQGEGWFGDFSPTAFQPRLDVVDDGDALRITAELPGLDRDDIEILVQDEYLILRGEKKLEKKNDENGCFRLERAFGSFQRILPLPDGIDLDRAEARFDKGVLTLRLPRAVARNEPQGRKLEIKGGNEASAKASEEANT